MSESAGVLYFVSYTLEGRRNPVKSRFRMTPEDAAARYAGMDYQLLEHDKIEVPAGLDMFTNSTSAFLRRR